MIRKISVSLILGIFVLINTPIVLAGRPSGDSCGPSYPTNPNEPCASKDEDCQLDLPTTPGNESYSCKYSPVSAAFGKVNAPSPLAGFLAKNPTGDRAISQFLSNGVTLIYSIATIVLIFMLLWGAFEWMTSGGDKEKLAAAQKRIISAIIGIFLFAVAFAIIRVLGQFTGFEFFSGS